MTDWQPIHTAPTDGTVVLLRQSNGPLVSPSVWAGAWSPEDKDFPWVVLDDGGETNGLRSNRFGPDAWAPMPKG